MSVKAVISAAFVLAPRALAAECFVCDRVVVLDPSSASCFRENAERFLEAARGQPTQWTEVNLAGCDASRGLDSFPALDEGGGDATDDRGGTSVSSVVFLDVAGIECLSRRLASATVTDILRVDLEAECE